MNLPQFICPRCHGAIATTAESHRCVACAALYPIVLGISDFRVFPDPWISLDDDRDKACRLAALVASLSLADSVRAYWEITPSTPRHLAEHYTEFVLGAESRSAEWLGWLDRAESAAESPWLDIGCGTGDLLAAAAARGTTVMGVDIALRWLVVAQRREALAGRAAQLVCANGEHLPFAARSFGRVISLGTLEHCRDADLVVAEARRVLQPGGVLRVRTVNRYSLLGEPHVRVWGVGLVPRRWADAYVRWRSGQRYQHHRPMSPREVGRGFRRAGFADVRIDASAILDAERSRIAAAVRWAVPVYEQLRRVPIIAGVLRWLAPLLDARGRSPG